MDLTRLEDGWKMDEYAIRFSVINFIAFPLLLFYFLAFLFSVVEWYDRRIV